MDKDKVDKDKVVKDKVKKVDKHKVDKADKHKVDKYQVNKVDKDKDKDKLDKMEKVDKVKFLVPSRGPFQNCVLVFVAFFVLFATFHKNTVLVNMCYILEKVVKGNFPPTSRLMIGGFRQFISNKSVFSCP